MKKRWRTLLAITGLLAFSAYVFFYRSVSAARNDLTLAFVGWTNLDRSLSPKGIKYVAYGPCALLAITNLNASTEVEFFSAVSVESFKAGRWTEVALATESPWLIGGEGWPPGSGREVPVRVLEGLSGENAWRVHVKYRLARPRGLRFLEDWWGILSPFERNPFSPSHFIATSSLIPAPGLRHNSNASTSQTSTEDTGTDQ